MAPRLASVAGVVSVFGSCGVTMWLNVPLNDRLAVASPSEPGAATLWETYLHEWRAANTGRTDRGVDDRMSVVRLRRADDDGGVVTRFAHGAVAA